MNVMCVEDFVSLVLIPVIQKLSPEQKAEFRQPWLDYVAEKELTKNYDRRFLKSIGVNPDGD